MCLANDEDHGHQSVKGVDINDVVHGRPLARDDIGMGTFIHTIIWAIWR